MRRASRVRRVRFVVGAIACVVLPAASWLAGEPTFAWTMYARSGEFRIDLLAFDADGRLHRRNPTLLAEHASPGAALLLAGSDHWRPGPSMATLRAHLDDAAAYACGQVAAASVELTLHERRTGIAEHSTTARCDCPR
jgi:hypothetical protein